MTRPTFRLRVLALLAVLVAPALLRADAPSNVPQFCSAQTQKCTSCHGDVANECDLLSLDLGETTPWTGSMPVHLKVRTSEASPSLSTPSQLKLVLGYTFMHLSPETPGGGENAVTFSDEAGCSLEFRFESGSSVGVPRFVMGGDAYTWDDMGVAVLRDASGFLRQVATRTRLADIVVHSATHYTVTVYPLTEDPQTDPDTGLLVPPPHDPVRVLDVRRGTTDRELIVGYRKGTGDMRAYRYAAKNGDWELTNPSGLIDANELYFTDDETGARRIHVWKDSDGTALRRMEANFVDKPWGWAMTNFIEGIPGDATRTTSWSYFESGSHRGLVQEKITPTGNRILYEYDDKNRVVRESMPLVEEETLYSYEPVDPSDPPLLCDTRPRCVVRKMQGIEIQRTYYVYGTNGVDVVERVGEQGAAYGGTNVLRTVTTYYPVTGAVTDGLVQSVRHEDGTIDNYAYDLANGIWTETVTHVHEQAPDIVPMRTTRSVRVYNSLGRLVDSRTDLCTIGVEDLVPQADWTPIERLQYAYDVNGNEIRREDLAGRLWTSEWAGNCCGKVSETDWQGITTTYAYDEEGRINTMTRHAPHPVETRFVRDRMGRVDTIFQTNVVDEIGTPPVICSYDSLSRVMERKQAGNIVRYSYPSEVSEVVVDSYGATNSVVFNPAGKPILVSGTAMPTRGYRTAARPMGHVVVTTSFFEEKEALFSTETEFDLLGRIVSRSRPGANGERMVRRYDYGVYGGVDRMKETGMPTAAFQRYPASGTESVRFLSENEWRNQESRTVYDVADGVIWKKTERTLTCSDEALSPLSRVVGRQMTGFTNGIVAFSMARDEHGSCFMRKECVDRSHSIKSVFVYDPRSIVPARDVYRFGRLCEWSDRFGATNTVLFDGLERVSEWLQGNGQTHEYEYDSSGRMVRDRLGENDDRLTYDDPGRLASIVRSDGSSVFFGRDQTGRIVSVTGDTFPAWFDYDLFGNLSEIDNRGNQAWSATKLIWDRASKTLKQIVCPDFVLPEIESGPRWKSPDRRFFHDVVGRPIAIQNDGVRAESIVRTAWGEFEASPWNRFEYDGFGRVVKCISLSNSAPVMPCGTNAIPFYANGSSFDSVPLLDPLDERIYENLSCGDSPLLVTNSYAYGPSGNLESEESPVGRLEKRFDDSGRIVSLSFRFFDHPGWTGSVEYAYNQLGRIGEARSGSLSLEYSWDAAGSLTAITSSLGSLTLQQDPADVSVWSSTRLTIGGEEKASFFRFRDQLSGYTTGCVECVLGHLSTSEFGHNRRGEIESFSTNGETRRWEYDIAGNRISELVGTNAWEYYYRPGDIIDAVRSKTGIADVQSNEYGSLFRCELDGHFDGWWDRGLLCSASSALSLQETTEWTESFFRWKYEYDAVGRLSTVSLMKRSEPEGSSTPILVKRYLWNGDCLAATMATSAGTTNIVFNVWAFPADGRETGSAHSNFPILCKTDQDSCFVPVLDPFGNVRAYVSESGRVAASCRYDPFGLMTEKDDVERFDLWFAARPRLMELGSYVFPHRLYHPRLGRWMSKDPIGFFGGFNLYMFCFNNPLDFQDETGLSPIPKPNETADGKCPCSIEALLQ